MAIMKVTPNEFINIVEPLYSSGIEVPTVMLWGPPGVGKSEAIRDSLAKRLAKNTGKRVIFTDVRLLLFNPVDLRGIPVPDKAHEFTQWLKPQIFNLDDSKDVINLLLLDEISSAPPTVQAAAYQLTLDRKVGEHSLPDNVIVLAAGNRVVDKGVAYKMPTPLANRMTHFEIYANLDDWKEWAIPNEIHPVVIGFLNWQQNRLHSFDPSKDDLAFPTPRSWSFVSKYLKIYNDIDKAYYMIAGTVGEGAAVEFKAFAKTYGSLPDVQKIMDGEEVQFQQKPDIMYALSASLSSRVGKAKKDQLKNITKFTMDKLPKEFAVLTMKDILRVPGVKEQIMVMKEWIEWAKKHKNLIVN
ncbi:ATPase family [compost metagenome]